MSKVREIMISVLMFGIGLSIYQQSTVTDAETGDWMKDYVDNWFK